MARNNATYKTGKQQVLVESAQLKALERIFKGDKYIRTHQDRVMAGLGFAIKKMAQEKGL